jgi:hypothetical protein
VSLAEEAAALVARELREHLSQASVRARLRLAGAARGLAPEEVDLTVERWALMLARRETGEAPLSVR